MNIEELKAKESKLWAEIQEIEKPLQAKKEEWSALFNQINAYEEREKIREELRAELILERKSA